MQLWQFFFKTTTPPAHTDKKVKAKEYVPERNSERLQNLLRLIKWAKGKYYNKFATLECRFHQKMNAYDFEPELEIFLNDCNTDEYEYVIIMDWLIRYGDPFLTSYRQNTLTFYMSQSNQKDLQRIITEARELKEDEPESITDNFRIRINDHINEIISKLNKLNNGDKSQYVEDSRKVTEFYWPNFISTLQQQALTSAITNLTVSIEKYRANPDIFKNIIKSLGNVTIIMGPNAPHYYNMLQFFYDNSNNVAFTEEQRINLRYALNVNLEKHIGYDGANDAKSAELVKKSIQMQIGDLFLNTSIISHLINTIPQEQWFIDEMCARARGNVSVQSRRKFKSVENIRIQFNNISHSLINHNNKSEPAFVNLFSKMLPFFQALYIELNSPFNTDKSFCKMISTSIFSMTSMFTREYSKYTWYTDVLNNMLHYENDILELESQNGIKNVLNKAPEDLFKRSGFTKVIKMLISKIQKQLAMDGEKHTYTVWAESNSALMTFMSLFIRRDFATILKSISINHETVEELINKKIKSLLARSLANEGSSELKEALNTLKDLCLKLSRSDNTVLVNKALKITEANNNLLIKEANTSSDPNLTFFGKGAVDVVIHGKTSNMRRNK